MPSRDRNSAGFSLIEMLAVLVIISLMTGIVVLSMPREKPAIETQGRLLAYKFDEAAQTSIISGQPQAFGFVDDAYYFYEFADGEWVETSETLWPDNLSLQFSRNDVKVETPEDPVPLVVFDPLGMSTPFSLRIEGEEETFTFSSSGDGKVYMETRL